MYGSDFVWKSTQSREICESQSQFFSPKLDSRGNNNVNFFESGCEKHGQDANGALYSADSIKQECFRDTAEQTNDLIRSPSKPESQNRSFCYSSESDETTKKKIKRGHSSLCFLKDQISFYNSDTLERSKLCTQTIGDEENHVVKSLSSSSSSSSSSCSVDTSKSEKLFDPVKNEKLSEQMNHLMHMISITFRQEAQTKKLRESIYKAQDLLYQHENSLLDELNTLKRHTAIYEHRFRKLKKKCFNVTVQEIEGIVSSGWSRSGHLGFLDITPLMLPILNATTFYPFKLLNNRQKDLDKLITTDLVEAQDDTMLNIIRSPPKPPHIPTQSIRIDFQCRIPYWNVFLCCFIQPQYKVIGLFNKEISSTQSNSSSCPKSLNLVLNGGTEKVITAVASRQQDTTTSHTTPSSLLNMASPGWKSKNAMLHNRGIRTIFILTENCHQIKSEALTSKKDLPFRKKPETSNLSVEEPLEIHVQAQIDDIVSQIKTPRVLGKPIETFWSKIFNIQMEPTHKYRKSIRELLTHYYEEENKFYKQFRNVLPGGLSAIAHTVPPEPKKMVFENTSHESHTIPDDVLSSILANESESNIESWDVTSSETSVSFLSESYKSCSSIDTSDGEWSMQDFDQMLLKKNKRLTSFDSEMLALDPQSMYTTTFEIGNRPNSANVLAEIVSDVMFKSDDDVKGILTGELDLFEPGFQFNGRSKNCMSPVACHVGVINQIPEHKNCVSGRVTEFWQLGYEPEANRAVWIYRGRIIKRL